MKWLAEDPLASSLLSCTALYTVVSHTIIRGPPGGLTRNTGPKWADCGLGKSTTLAEALSHSVLSSLS
jgi:hypothetical protein